MNIILYLSQTHPPTFTPKPPPHTLTLTHTHTHNTQHTHTSKDMREERDTEVRFVVRTATHWGASPEFHSVDIVKGYYY